MQQVGLRRWGACCRRTQISQRMLQMWWALVGLFCCLVQARRKSPTNVTLTFSSVELSLTSYINPTWHGFNFPCLEYFRNVRKVLRQHKLRWTRSRVVLQELPRPKVRTKGIRIRRRCRLLVHGQRWPVQERRVSRSISLAFDVFFYWFLNYDSVNIKRRSWTR